MLNLLTRRGLHLAILTNKPDESAREMVARLLPQWKFSVVQGEKPSLPKKPDPTTALGIAHTLQILPPEIIFLGDSGVDMETAVAAGMYPVGVLWGFRTAEELVASGAKALIVNTADLLTILTP